MTDRLLARLLNTSIVTMIAVVAAAAIIFGYRGLLDVLSDETVAGGIMLAISPLLAATAWLLIRNRADLVGC